MTAQAVGSRDSLRGKGGRPLRVAHLTTVDMSLALLLATELKVDVESGFATFGISGAGPYVERVTALGVTHVTVPSLTRAWDLGRDLRAARELWQVLRALELDVLHTHNPKTGVLGRILGRAAGVPVVVNTCHGLWVRPEDSLVKKALVYGAEAIAARFSHAELYQNDADRRTMRWAVPRRRATTVGNGVDLNRFRRDEAARRRFREELGATDDDLLVGGVGRLVLEKGIEEFAAMAETLRGRARFVWVGPTDEDKADRVTAEAGAVEFLGARDDMPAVYSGLDLFVLPSHREGFSRSAMEAAACGCPLVLTDIRGCREIGTHGEHLLLVPVRNAVALTEAVEGLLDDAGLRARLGAAAAQRAHREFDQRRIAAHSIEAYVGASRRAPRSEPEYHDS